jgi:hypothetical protein
MQAFRLGHYPSFRSILIRSSLSHVQRMMSERCLNDAISLALIKTDLRSNPTQNHGPPLLYTRFHFSLPELVLTYKKTRSTISLTPRNPPIGGFQGFGALDIFLKPPNWGVSSRYGDDSSTTKKCHVPNFEMCNVIANKLF